MSQDSRFTGHRRGLFSLVAKSFLTLWDSIDCSTLGSSVHGISQAKILESVSISSSRGPSRPRHQTSSLCLLHYRWILYHCTELISTNCLAVVSACYTWGCKESNTTEWLTHTTSISFFKFTYLFLWIYSWFTMLYWFSLYSKVTQLYICVYIYIYIVLFSIMVYHSILNVVP